MKNQSPTGRLVTRRCLLGGAAAAVTGGTFWALDRFVVEHAEVTDASSQWQSVTGAATSGATLTSTTTATTATSVSVSRRTVGSGSDVVTYYVAELRLGQGTDLRAAFAKDTFGENVIEYTSATAKANNAKWAINGDYYGFRDDGIVIRNGIVFRDRGVREGLAFQRDGKLRLFDETATSADRLIDDGAWHTLSFGPGIVSGGQVVSGIDSIEIDTNVGNHSIQGNQPRTGIGMISADRLVAVVVDGRAAGYSRGVSMTGLAQIFTGLGAQVAYNLDGGGSSVMYQDGALVSNPLGKHQERGTSDILYVAG